MATFTITTTSKPSNPPTVVGDSKVDMANGGTFIFQISTITTETSPQYLADGNAVSKFKLLTTNYVNGEFQLSGATLSIGTEVDAKDIASGLLTYVDDGTNTASHETSVTYTLSDVGSNSFSADSGFIGIRVNAIENSKPTIVGNGAETISFGESLVFTKAMFTTDADAVYSDPEGDSVDKLKITSLPSAGSIKLNGNFVKINQEIDFSDIDSGLLVYAGDASNLSANSSTFDYEISDSGSGLFKG